VAASAHRAAAHPAVVRAIRIPAGPIGRHAVAGSTRFSPYFREIVTAFDVLFPQLVPRPPLEPDDARTLAETGV
jgi:hypothetical protein